RLGCGTNSCHNRTEPPHSITNRSECYKCHDKTMNPDGTINKNFHIVNNGAGAGHLDVKDFTCDACHDYPPANHLPFVEGMAEDEAAMILQSCFLCHPVPGSAEGEVDSPFPQGFHQNGFVDFVTNR
ncbi:MAG: hypothetical protein Q7S00_05615, partial [bacterium]|nr:hypothetical protein [bacterium]